LSKLLRATLSALLLVGCVSAAAEPPEARTAIKRYYEAYASENIGQCLAPYIDGFTGIQVIESGPERMVLEVRYMYRDRVKDQQSSGDQAMRNVCVGFGERRFVLANSQGAWRVEEMSGPQRRQAPAPDRASG
jgi:hypothetical protein